MFTERIQSCNRLGTRRHWVTQIPDCMTCIKPYRPGFKVSKSRVQAGGGHLQKVCLLCDPLVAFSTSISPPSVVRVELCATHLNEGLQEQNVHQVKSLGFDEGLFARNLSVLADMGR